MKTQNKLIAAAALALSALPLSAQDQPAPVQRPAASLFDLLDANHDGNVDSSEIDKAADALRKMDRNSDGKIAPDEFRLPRQQNAEANPNPERRRDAAPSPEADRPQAPRANPERRSDDHRRHDFRRPEAPQSQRGPERGGRDMQRGPGFQHPPFHGQKPPMGPPPGGFHGQHRGPHDMNQGPQNFQRPPFQGHRPPMGPRPGDFQSPPHEQRGPQPQGPRPHHPERRD